jgi:hypothetical protein
MSPDKTQFGDRFEGHMLPPRISKTDEDFAAQNLEFVYSQEGLSISELNEVFEKVRLVFLRGLGPLSAVCTRRSGRGMCTRHAGL